MSTTEFNSIDEWLNNRTGTERSGSGFMKNWKKDGSIVVWIHTKRLPANIWHHTIPQLQVFEDKDTKETRKEFWSKKMVCWESSSLLKKQFKRNRETGARDMPPVRCPICKLSEHLRKMVNRGRLEWTDKAFVFKGATDPEKNGVIHVGGFYGAFSGELDDEDKAQLREAGIKQSQAWRENTTAKENTIFCVVNNDKVSEGVLITTETGLLGDKVKGVINDQIADQGDAGNPIKNPYAIEWIYDDTDGIAFDKRYHARPVRRHKITDEIHELITGDPPDLTNVTAPFNIASMRTFLEKYAVIEIPWDEIFAEVADGEERPQAHSRDSGETRSKTTPAKKDPEPEEEPKKAGGRRGRRVATPTPPEPPPEPAVAMIPCDNCNKPMREDATKCKSCGTEYELEEEPEEKPKAASTKGAAPTPKAPDSSRSGGGAAEDFGFGDSDEIPF